MSTYLTFIPYVNRPDLLGLALEGVQNMWSRTLVIDNSPDAELTKSTLPVSIWTPPVPLDFAQTQNLMQRFAIEGDCDFYFFLHSDAKPEGDSAQKLLELVSTLPKDWGVVFTNGDAFCAFNVEAVKKTGKWDWRGLNWYFSDKDYYRRLELSGFKAIYSDLPVKHVPSQTRGADKNIEIVVKAQLTAANTYYILKWGGPPGKEIFAKPFNLDCPTDL